MMFKSISVYFPDPVNIIKHKQRKDKARQSMQESKGKKREEKSEGPERDQG
jgi:hypothetical protein